MKIKKFILSAIFALLSFASFACGPSFPETYIGGDKQNRYENKPFEYSYNWNRELNYIVLEKFKDIAKWHTYPDSKISTEMGNKLDYKEKISSKNKGDKSVTEFELYEAGKQEMFKNCNSEKIPKSWLKLLSLPQKQRRYRTIWACYMIGNLHAASGNYELAKRFYHTVKESSKKGFKDTLGLAHATYKRDFLSAINAKETKDILNSALEAIAYYSHSKDYKRCKFIFDSLEAYMIDLQKSGKSIKGLLNDSHLKEMLISFTLKYYGTWDSADKNGIINQNIQEIIDEGDSETVARFAWLAYRNGNIELAKKLLPSAKKEGLLTLWVSAKLALYEGKDGNAVKYLRNWLAICNKNRNRLKQSRLAPGFNDAEKAEKDVYGILGNAIIHTKDFTEALHCFIRAEDWPSAAVIADNLISLEELIKYVNKNMPNYYYENLKSENLDNHNAIYGIIWYTYVDKENESDYTESEAIKNRLRYLLARRLVRNKKPTKALTYIPGKLLQPLKNLIFHLQQSENKELPKNKRAMAAYNAARIMRWYGMSLSGTELWPDYQYLGGYFNYFTTSPDWAEERGMDEIAKIAKTNTPKDHRRFHYRFKACDIMRNSLKLAEDDDLKLLANLAIGYWLHDKYPKEADPYYKAVVGFRPYPIAVELDKLRWFPKKNNLPAEFYNQIFSTKPLTELKNAAKIAKITLKNERNIEE